MNKNVNMGNLIFVDVEASGSEGGGGVSPATGVMTEFGAVHYKSGERFHGVIWKAKPREDNPAVSDPEFYHGIEREKEIMEEFKNWVAQVSTAPNGAAVFVSDNPAYDFQWINFYFDKHDIKNPFGHSARRIGDFYAGVVRDWRAASKWKKLRDTKHDHHPVHDAQGNVEAFRKIMKMIEEE